MTANSSTVEQRVRAELDEVNRDAGDDPIRVGILTPLSGPGDASAGELVCRGARLGAEYVREHGGVCGRQIALIAENDQATAAVEGMPRSAVGGMAKLAILDEVVAALGQWHLRTTGAVAETAERLGVPIFIENGHSTVTAEHRRTVFRTYYTVAERADMMADFMVAHGMKRVAILSADTVFGLSTAEAIAQAGRRHGIEFLTLDFPQETTTDLRAELQEIQRFQPDLFINGGVIRTNYLIVEQATELGLRPAVPMMATFGYPLRSGDYWRLAGPAGNGVIWPATYYRPSWSGLTPIGQWFTDRYRERYGSFPPDTSLSAFTDVTLIAAALEKAPRIGRDELIDSLEAHEFMTWRGPVRFERRDDHWHHNAPGIYLMQYQKVDQDFDDAEVIFPEQVRTAFYAAPEQLV